MPHLGDIKRGIDIGYKGHINYIWSACSGCGKERWTHLVRGEPESSYCYCCCRKRMNILRGEQSPAWKGGRHTDKQGYIKVFLQPNDFFYPMADKRHYIPEHRLVVAQSLGRCLTSQEIVHHKGIRYSGIKNRSDNLGDNLELTATIGEHISNHSRGYTEGFQRGYADGIASAQGKASVKR